MTLKVLLPERVLLEQEVAKVTAEAENGSFCLLPGHIDFTAALVPGILSFEDLDGQEGLLPFGARTWRPWRRPSSVNSVRWMSTRGKPVPTWPSWRPVSCGVSWI